MALWKTKLILIFPFILSCTKDVGVINTGSNYPKEIEKLISGKCAVEGCHNTISKDASAGLSLSSWEALFNGSRGGAVVIPYRPDFSTLCYYTNSYSDLGPSLEPKMPINKKALTREEYLTLSNWIKEGAPNETGIVKFSNSLSKFYITNQLCDIVTIIDAESKLPMRYINVGILSKTEFPVCIKLSPDKKYWYVSFLASTILQKFDASNDTYVSQIDLGQGVWSSFEITSDSKSAFCVDNSSPGKIAYVDLESMNLIKYFKNTDFIYPRSVSIHTSLKKIYTGTENGNYISIINFNDPSSPSIKQLILDGNIINHNTSVDPGFLYIEESLNLCVIACSGSKELKFLDTRKDSLINTIHLEVTPTCIDVSKNRKQLFITCNDDSISFPGTVGSLKIVDIQTAKIIKTINPGYQPNGICVNEVMGYVAVVNSNISPKGPRPHHTSACSGRNGYVTFIDLNTLELIPNNKYELAVYPYAIALRK